MARVWKRPAMCGTAQDMRCVQRRTHNNCLRQAVAAPLRAVQPECCQAICAYTWLPRITVHEHFLARIPNELGLNKPRFRPDLMATRLFMKLWVDSRAICSLG